MFHLLAELRALAIGRDEGLLTAGEFEEEKAETLDWLDWLSVAKKTFGKSEGAQ